ncbi:RasGEF domain containing protein [Histomonas meleagridis]|uniref:RasGEF domain containing protein n=1 Tax=Histomonas meleagridis TaxID=135588 RepID=UPI00355A6F49|nr:RasGEF domain containing protein [Histomonas meleagridis]KAH0805844.1 RasGEF domain containing protein [Histomonas meleagridis]
MSSLPVSDASSTGSNIAPTLTQEQLADERSHWLPRILEQNPHLLELRERTLPWTGGYSFANVVHTAMTASPTPVNRHAILQLIVNHLNAIGMKKTAETIIKETGHKFQLFDQPWEKTDLLILLSLGLLPREDPWNIPKDPLVQFVEEPLEEDFFASPYREDPHDLYQEILNPELNITFTEGPRVFKNIATASLKRLVVCLTLSPPDFITSEDYSQFFLTLHSITSSQHFLEHLIALFDLDFSDPSAVEQLKPNQKEIRVTVINLISRWINFHGLFIGKKTLNLISTFIRRIIDESEDLMGSKDYLNNILTDMENLTFSQKQEQKSVNLEPPIIRDPQVLFKPSLTLVDPEPVEVARQITLLSHETFKSVHSREFMEALMNKKCTIQTPTLAEFFDFNEKLSKIILETVITSNDRNGSFSRVLEIAQSLDFLCNFQALSAILNQLSREEVLFVLEATKEQRDMIDSLSSKCGNGVKSYDDYLTTVKSRYDKKEPAIPNISSELKFADSKKAPDFINNLINYSKRRQMVEKASMFYQFQNKSYPFFPVQQIQKVIKRGTTMSDKAIENKIVELWRNLKKLQ